MRRHGRNRQKFNRGSGCFRPFSSIDALLKIRRGRKNADCKNSRESFAKTGRAETRDVHPAPATERVEGGGGRGLGSTSHVVRKFHAPRCRRVASRKVPQKVPGRHFNPAKLQNWLQGNEVEERRASEPYRISRPPHGALQQALVPSTQKEQTKKKTRRANRVSA